MSRDIGRAWNILYSLATENLDKKQREKWDSEVFRKPFGVQRSGGDAVDQALEAGAQAYLKELEQRQAAIGLEGEGEPRG